MKTKLTDEQLDKLIHSLMSAACADEATMNEITDSPKIWWEVQRQINEQKGATLSLWPPVGKVLRWLMIGAPVTAALIISFFVFRPLETPDYSAVTQPVSVAIDDRPTTDNSIAEPSINTEVVQPSAKYLKREVAAAKFRAGTKRMAVRSEAINPTNKRTEIKTEFIALSYARDPESGQIVRVKVPSSMMVSLGLVSSVKQPSDLVDAEVLVGDDGLTRAIRFIR